MTLDDLYAIDEKDQGAPIKVTESEARKLNEKGYGVFWSVNKFGEYRRTECLSQIRAWHVDIDGLPKVDQVRLINSSPIYPSKVIESKNGYHIYFNAQNASLFAHKYVLKGLCQHFHGDQRAAIVTALLRAPGFKHWKDQDSPFVVREVFSSGLSYTESQMRYFFPFEMKDKEIVTPRYNKKHIGPIDDLTDFLNNLDCEYGLKVLSGTSHVNGEVYSFKPTVGGKLNILVNGKSTSCFIDADKRIGAVPGGPTLWQWLKYYGHNDSKIYSIIKELFE